ncbi:MAG: hypothetical protein ACP5RE_03535 [Candidatus Acidifodinimicrobium sp.]
MEFKLKKYYEGEEYNQILRIIKSFKGIKTDNGWYMTTSMYRSMVEAMKINLGDNPTEPVYGMTELYQVLLKDKVEKPELAAIIKQAQFDPDIGVLTMNEEVFQKFTDFCEKNGVKYYILKDADKIDVWEKETTMSLLYDIRKEMEAFNYRAILSSTELTDMLRIINENQEKLAKDIGVNVKKIYQDVQTGKEPETVLFIYKSIDPIILYVKDEDVTDTKILRFQDILTLRKDVAEELVKLKKGEIIEEKGTRDKSKERT